MRDEAEVELSPAQVAHAMDVGTRRQAYAVEQRLDPLYGQPRGKADVTGERRHQIGALAELAFAIFWRVEWQPLVGGLDTAQGDVDGVQVRGTPYPNGRLPLHPRDADTDPFVLVVGNPPVLRVVGGCRGYEGKRDEFWRTDIRHPCYLVPQRVLHSMTGRRCGCGRHYEGPYDRCLKCELLEVAA